MKTKIALTLMLPVIIAMQQCSTEELRSTSSFAVSTASVSVTTAVAQTSSQLASGTSFKIEGSASDSITDDHGHGHHPGHGHPDFLLDGTNLLAPTDELLAVIDAESAGDIRGLRMHMNSGGTVTNYDSAGQVIAMATSMLNAGAGCSFSGGQFPQTDSALARITKTVVDFGTGVTQKHDTITITRAGSITITRSLSGNTRKETIVFNGYTVNGIAIEGTKTRVSSLVTSGSKVNGNSATLVTGGKFTFSDGSVAAWTSDKQRATNLVLDTKSRPSSGTITSEGSTYVTLTDGTVIYSHKISKTLTENIACAGHHGPVSGTVETVYRTNTITAEFGEGSCDSNTVTLTVNGVTTTRKTKA